MGCGRPDPAEPQVCLYLPLAQAGSWQLPLPCLGWVFPLFTVPLDPRHSKHRGNFTGASDQRFLTATISAKVSVNP